MFVDKVCIRFAQVFSVCLQAHQQCRKADRLLAAGKYEEAVLCHGKAAGTLWDVYIVTPAEVSPQTKSI